MQDCLAMERAYGDTLLTDTATLTALLRRHAPSDGR
jgi:hypothetical protein